MGALALLAPCYGIAFIDMSSLLLFRSSSGWLSSILGQGVVPVPTVTGPVPLHRPSRWLLHALPTPLWVAPVVCAPQVFVP